MDIHGIENRVHELMQEGKQSQLRGWSARQIADTISSEWRDKKAGEYAFAYIKHTHSKERTDK